VAFAGAKMIKRQLHFLTFGAGAGNPGAARRLARQAEATGLFASLSYETGDEIFSRWPEFALHRPFVEANVRGWGYWIWKPFLIKTYLDRIKAGEALVYFDAGCEILPSNRNQLSRLFNHLNNHDAMVWNYAEHPIFNLVFWTKQNLLDRAAQEFGLTNPIKIAKVWAGNIGLVKTKRTLSLVDDWFRLSTADNYCLVDNTPASAPQRCLLVEHRFDQSILSVLVAAYGIERCGSAFDYCYGRPHVERWPILLDKPFLAMRNRGPESQIEPIRLSLKFEIRRQMQRMVGIIRSSERAPLNGWSHQRANELTMKYGHELITLGLM
jgi:hypothetical protein